MSSLYVLFVCSYGMSTSLVTEAVKTAAAKREVTLTLQSIGTEDVKKLSAKADVIMLGPQVRYAQSTIRKYGKPVEVIDSFLYATADGDKILERILVLAEQTAGCAEM